MTFNALADYLTVALALIALIGVIYVARSKGVLDTYKRQVDSLEGLLGTLQGELDALKGEVADLRKRDEAHREAAILHAEAVARAGICALASQGCPQRVIPKASRKGL